MGNTNQIKLYSYLINAYPSKYKKDYKKQMISTFEDMLQDAKTFKKIKIWLEVLYDLLKTIPHQYITLFKERTTPMKDSYTIRFNTIGSILAFFIASYLIMQITIELIYRLLDPLLIQIPAYLENRNDLFYVLATVNITIYIVISLILYIIAIKSLKIVNPILVLISSAFSYIIMLFVYNITSCIPWAFFLLTKRAYSQRAESILEFSVPVVNILLFIGISIVMFNIFKRRKSLNKNILFLITFFINLTVLSYLTFPGLFGVLYLPFEFILENIPNIGIMSAQMFLYTFALILSLITTHILIRINRKYKISLNIFSRIQKVEIKY